MPYNTILMVSTSWKYKALTKVVAAFFILIFYQDALSQCNPPAAPGVISCSLNSSFGANSINATNPSFTITDHVWYASTSGSTLSTIQPNHEGLAFPGSSTYISSYNGNFPGTTTVYVAAVCNGVETARTALTFTYDPGAQIAIQTNGNPTSVCAGTGFTLTASEGFSNLQWRLGSASGSVISTASSYVPTQSDSYFLTGTNACGISQTTSVPVTIYPSLTPSVSISADQNNVCQGTLITFTATPINGGTSPYYYWRVQGAIVSSGPEDTFHRSDLNDGDVVDVIMYHNLPCPVNGVTSVPSNGVAASITQRMPLRVEINAQMPLCAGLGNFFATVYNGLGTLTYTWYRNNNPVTDNSPGAPANLYAPQNALIGDDIVKCVVSSNGCVSNNPASDQVTVSTTSLISPALTVGASPLSICEGGNATFTASPINTGYGITSYSWQLNGGSIGGNSSSVSTTQFTATSQVSVTVGFSGTCLAYSSKTFNTAGAPITVTPYPNAYVNPSGTDIICSNCSDQITAFPNGTGYSYQWRKDGAPIFGETSYQYTASANGTYSADVSYNGCNKTSSNTLIVVKNIAPVVQVGSDQTIILPIRTVTITGSATDSDGTIASYVWAQVSGPSPATLSGATTATLIASGLESGAYAFNLKVKDNFGESAISSNVTVTVSVPPNNYNYVQETVVLLPSMVTEQQLAPLTSDQKTVNISYVDGLGRPMQSVSWQNSPGKMDAVQPIIYDAFGREPKKYLPYVSTENNVQYKINPVGSSSYAGSPHQVFYNNGTADKIKDDSAPYAETIFEASPLNRAIKQGAPGSDWQPDPDPLNMNDHVIKKKYELNVLEEVLLFKYDITTGLVSLNSDINLRYYLPNQLYANKTYDESSNEVIEYVDKEGRTICKKVQVSALNNAKQYACTYYIYDDFGNLSVVLPPEAVTKFN